MRVRIHRYKDRCCCVVIGGRRGPCAASKKQAWARFMAVGLIAKFDPEKE